MHETITISFGRIYYFSLLVYKSVQLFIYTLFDLFAMYYFDDRLYLNYCSLN